MERTRLVVAVVMLAFGVVSWPLARLVFARSEPGFVIDISELALIYEAWNSLQLALDKKERSS